MKNLHVIGKELFITSDEEIKKDDYYLGDDNHIYCLCTTVNSNGKKIILTTNADYIEEGIQAIDDEFLEWFVQNPSCEEVEFKINYSNSVMNYSYKIIIPKEEPEQETLEEVAERFSNTYAGDEVAPAYEGFIDGANYQAERMYSEEDLREAYLDGCKIQLTNIYHLEKWFEQFKKK